MKTKKSSDKTEIKVKANKSLILRNDSKVKQKSIQSSERLCSRCKVHGITVSFKGHKCPKADCHCVKCMDQMEKNRRKNEQYKKRQLEKKTNKDNTKPSDNISFVNSLKNKSKKILNNKKKDKKSEKKMGGDGTASKAKRKRKSRISGGVGSGRGSGGPSSAPQTNNHLINIEDDGSSPPRLLLQQAVNEPPIDAIIGSNSSSTDVDISHSNAMEAQPVPEKSSAALCAQYLKACEGLSRNLLKCQFSEHELIASLKYFIVRQSLGDIERATEDIICASQEIRLGASYIIEHPFDTRNPEQTSTSVRQTIQQGMSNAVVPPMLSSTMYPNHRSKDAQTYSPAFTPIRPN